jgi:hypothetical protein
MRGARREEEEVGGEALQRLRRGRHDTREGRGNARASGGLNHSPIRAQLERKVYPTQIVLDSRKLELNLPQTTKLTLRRPYTQARSGAHESAAARARTPTHTIENDLEHDQTASRPRARARAATAVLFEASKGDGSGWEWRERYHFRAKHEDRPTEQVRHRKQMHLYIVAADHVGRAVLATQRRCESITRGAKRNRTCSYEKPAALRAHAARCARRKLLGANAATHDKPRAHPQRPQQAHARTH